MFKITQIAGELKLDDQNGLIGDINDDVFTFLLTDGTERKVALLTEKVLFEGKKVVITGIKKMEAVDADDIPHVIRISTLEAEYRDLLGHYPCDCCG